MRRAATIDEIGAATLQTLRTTLGKVRQAERLVEEAEAQLQAARASTAEEAGKLSRALGALGVEIPADLATPLRAILYPPRGRGAARPMAAVPAQTCPDCNQPVIGCGRPRHPPRPVAQSLVSIVLMNHRGRLNW